MLDNTKSFWANTWSDHLQSYNKKPPRTGRFIENYFKKNVDSILELACGSGRDARFLTRSYSRVIMSDFDKLSIHQNVQKYPEMITNPIVCDAFNLPFMTNSVDLVYHNGFFILFAENEAIFKLIREEMRISKKFVFILVHNKEHIYYPFLYHLLKKSNPLYDFRFFSKNEIYSIVRKAVKGDSIKMVKFGSLFDPVLNRIPLNLFPESIQKIVFFINFILYRVTPWSLTERIGLIIYHDTT